MKQIPLKATALAVVAGALLPGHMLRHQHLSEVSYSAGTLDREISCFNLINDSSWLYSCPCPCILRT